MGRINIERVRSQADIPRQKAKKDIPRVGHLGDLVVKNSTERARREDYAGLSAYWLRSNGASSTGRLNDPNLSHNLIIRAGAGLTGTTPTAANNQGDCQVYCQNGGLHTTTVVSSENNLAGGPSGAHWFRILYGDCTETASQEARNVGTLSASDFQRLCTDYANTHPAPTQPPMTEAPSTQPTTVTTEPPTEPIEPSSSAVPMEVTSSYGYSSSVADSLAYISSSVPSSTYQQIVATTQAHTSSPAFSSTAVLIPASSQVPTATVLPNLITDGTTGAPAGGGVDGAAIGFSFLGVGAAVAILVSGIAGTTKVIKSYLSYREAHELKANELPVRYTNIPNS